MERSDDTNNNVYKATCFMCTVTLFLSTHGMINTCFQRTTLKMESDFGITPIDIAKCVQNAHNNSDWKYKYVSYERVIPCKNHICHWHTWFLLSKSDL